MLSLFCQTVVLYNYEGHELACSSDCTFRLLQNTKAKAIEGGHFWDTGVLAVARGSLARGVTPLLILRYIFSFSRYFYALPSEFRATIWNGRLLCAKKKNIYIYIYIT